MSLDKSKQVEKYFASRNNRNDLCLQEDQIAASISLVDKLSNAANNDSQNTGLNKDELKTHIAQKVELALKKHNILPDFNYAAEGTV